jgi:hypothetical protein
VNRSIVRPLSHYNAGIVNQVHTLSVVRSDWVSEGLMLPCYS